MTSATNSSWRGQFLLLTHVLRSGIRILMIDHPVAEIICLQKSIDDFDVKHKQ